MLITNIKTIDKEIKSTGKPTVYEVTRVFIRDNKFEYIKGTITQAEYDLWKFMTTKLNKSDYTEFENLVNDYGQEQYENGFEENENI